MQTFSRIRLPQRIPRPRCLRAVRRPMLLHRPLSSGLSSENVGPRPTSDPAKTTYRLPDQVPTYCPGCGAPSQRVDDALPGFYPEQMSRRQRFGGNLKVQSRQRQTEDDIFEQAMSRVLSEQQSTPALEDLAAAAAAAQPTSVPPPNVCIRCHNLVHHHSAPPLSSYPTLDTLATLLVTSGHRTNHIYHLLDAADLPLSLVPALRAFLLSRLPGELRRGLTISYVVTRADIMMPTEGLISSLMTWIKKVVKDALPSGEKVETECDRIHAISVRNGWGVGAVKREIEGRGGGVWVLGAVNVGKSRFVREMWPEGGKGKSVGLGVAGEYGILPEKRSCGGGGGGGGGGDMGGKASNGESNPAPHIGPTVSDIPGTTAAPIKVAYKTSSRGGKVLGELVDLPGLERWVGFPDSGLLKYVRDDKKTMVGMNRLIKSEQRTIKPGQSMILGGLVLITPKVTGLGGVVVLANAYTSLPAHVMANEKSLKWLSYPDPASSGFSDILFYKPDPASSLSGIQPHKPPPLPHTKGEEGGEALLGKKVPKLYMPPPLPPHFSSAGTFLISEDVTLRRNPQLFGAQLARLPYLCLGADILLEGIGWVELNVQISKSNTLGDCIEVEVFTPGGRGVGLRSTMGAAMLRKQALKRNIECARARKPAKGSKKMLKMSKRGKE